jgi:hypothetical protein
MVFTPTVPYEKPIRVVKSERYNVAAIPQTLMKLLFAFPVTLLLAVGAGAQQAQQSLADVARQTRTDKKSSAIARFDDDSMRRSPELEPATDEKDAKKEAQSGKAADGQDKDKKDADKSKAAEWSKKIEAQKKEIETLKRELDIRQREQRLRAASFYADAGTRIRDQGKFAEDSRQEQEQIDAKKQALDAAQQKLADLQEQARKAGASSE